MDELFGCPDRDKFLSSMTLFYQATGDELFLKAMNLYKKDEIDLANINNEKILKENR